MKLVKKTLASILSAVALTIPSAASARESSELPPNFETESWTRYAVLGTNVLAGGLEGGIGSMVKSKKKWDWESFGKGFLKGALGGVVVYAGYEVAASGAEFPLTGWFGAKVADLGHSMVHNALDGKDIFYRYESYVGPFYFAVEDIAGKPKFDLALHTASFLGLSYGIMGGYKLDWKNSLSYLTPVFIVDHDIIENHFTTDAVGFTIGTAMFYYEGKNAEHILSHENIHRSEIGRYNALNDIAPLLKENHLVILGDATMLISALKGYFICEYISPKCYLPFTNTLEFEAYTLEH